MKVYKQPVGPDSISLAPTSSILQLHIMIHLLHPHLYFSSLCGNFPGSNLTRRMASENLTQNVKFVQAHGKGKEEHFCCQDLKGGSFYCTFCRLKFYRIGLERLGPVDSYRLSVANNFPNFLLSINTRSLRSHHVLRSLMIPFILSLPV